MRQSSARFAPRRRPVLEELEIRIVPSTLDGSFQTVQIDQLRANPDFAGIDGHGIGIAVIDTGIFAQNPDLKPNVKAWFDAVTLDNNAPDDDPNFAADSLAFAFDPEGHGSHTAGIAASSNPVIGAAAGADIIAIRGLPAPTEPRPNFDTVLEGLQWVFDHRVEFNIKVVNMSLGVLQTNLNQVPDLDAEGQMIQALESAGVAVVISSGNNYASFTQPGASLPSVFGTFTVANTWPTDYNFNGFSFSFAANGVPFAAFETQGKADSFAATSQRSALPNQLAAPGQQIFSTWTDREPSSLPGDPNHEILNGTSMSAPLVSGIIALMQQAAQQFLGHPLSVADVQKLVLESADTIVDSTVTSNGRSPFDATGQLDFNNRTDLPETGLSYKRINALKAVQAVADLAPGGSIEADNTSARALDVGNLNGTAVLSQSGNVGIDGRAQVGLADVDVFKVNLTSTGVITATIGGSNQFTPALRLFDATGTEIDRNFNPATGGISPNFLQRAKQPAGSYFLGVSAPGNIAYDLATGSGAGAGSQGGAYLLSISLNNPDPDGVIPGATLTRFPSVENGIIGSDAPPAGASTSLQVGPGDVDMYRVVASDDGDLVLTLSVTGFADPLPSLLRVFDPQGNQVAAQAGAGVADNVLRVANVKLNDTFFVAVSDKANAAYDAFNPYTRDATGHGGQYKLSLSFDNRDRNGSAQDAVLVQIGTPLPFAIGTDPDPGGGAPILVGHDGSRDVDFFRFHTDAAGFLSIKVDGADPFVPALSLQIYDEANQNILKLGEVTGDPAELIQPVEANKDYWAAITGKGNENFKWFSMATGNGGQTGSATLITTLLPATAGASLTNNAVTIAGQTTQLVSLTPGALVVDSIGRDGNVAVGAADVDLFRFTAPAALTLQVRTSTGAEGSAHTFLRVFNTAGSELAFSGDGQAGNTSNALRLELAAGQTVLIGVSGAGAGARSYNPLTGAGAVATPDSLGSYLLTIAMTLHAPAPLPPSAPTTTSKTTSPPPTQTISPPATFTLTAAPLLTARRGQVSFAGARLVLHADPHALLRARITSTLGRLALRGAGVKVTGNNTRSLAITGTTAALQKALKQMSLALARGQKRAVVTVSIFEGARGRSVRITVRG